MRLRKIEALDLRPVRQSAIPELVQCVDCNRRFIGVDGRRCLRCQLVVFVAELVGESRTEAWQRICREPDLAEWLLDEHAAHRLQAVGDAIPPPARRPRALSHPVAGPAPATTSEET